MTKSSWLAIAIVGVALTAALLTSVGFPSGWLQASSGLERVSGDLSLRRDCTDEHFLQWEASDSTWPCSNTLAAPDINGGTWNGELDGASTATAGLTFADSVAAAWGTDGDYVTTLNSAGLAANEELADVIIGTSVYANAIPANSGIVSSITDDSDIVFFTATGGNSIEGMRIDASARSVVLPQVDDALTPTLAFGAGGTGFYDSGDDTIRVAIGGNLLWTMAAGVFGSLSADKPSFLDEAASATNPNIVTDRGNDVDTGIGHAAANQLSLIAGGVEGIRIIGAGDIDLTPTANTDASSDPLLIQNVSQTTAPGTTVDGQIRLWQDSDAGGVDGRIVFQVGGTTYQVNADAGLTFLNNPDILARDIALFTVGFEQWQIDRAQQADDLWPAIGLVRLAPSFSQAYLNHLNTQYAIADAYFIANSLDEETPLVPTVPEIKAENPWPNPATVTVPDATINETVGFRSGDNMVVGDPVVMVVDRLKFNASEGENWGVHMVPSTLTDEFLWLLDNDAAFLASVKTKLGIP